MQCLNPKNAATTSSRSNNINILFYILLSSCSRALCGDLILVITAAFAFFEYIEFRFFRRFLLVLKYPFPG